jgi:hypothetical protein
VRLAARLALLGAALGVLAGLTELTVGPEIREWVGDKQDTTRLGLATTALSAVALASAVVLRRRRSRTPSQRLAITLGLLVPALVCFTTVGRLWLVPGPLLLAAAGLVLAESGASELMRAVDEPRWRSGLLALCGAYFVFLGASAFAVPGLLGVLGGLLIWAAIAAAARSHVAAYTLLALGVVPFAIATWWSVVTPVIAVLALTLGHGVIARTRLIDSGARIVRPAP